MLSCDVMDLCHGQVTKLNWAAWSGASCRNTGRLHSTTRRRVGLHFQLILPRLVYSQGSKFLEDWEIEETLIEESPKH